ncbi:mannose-6-phosphate receptor binding protein 1 isoform X1 [Gadus macrocephalus]|uniref:mannose-6-phosphate receptor binding protein 1 isoform X1 n=1 Tax=Gadus macrocephalus TaxID=80720 RepID=UPI0028CB2654|nr:mannose-6-phosphate receptor binding protein 1 isoform X1 [Gadus macrocephalus]
MADSGNEVVTEAAQPANGEQGLVSRVSNLPLVSSACGAVASAYTSTRDSVPLLKGVMDVAETGVRTLGAAASTGSKPLLDMLEPQITAVSDYALLGLDKMEATLPILQQPADKLVSDTVGRVYQSVTGARDAVTGARDAVTGAVMGAVMGGVELTKAAVSGGVSTVMGSRLGQMASSGVGLALSRSETWVEQNLPLSERELAALAEPAPGAVSAGVAPPAAASYFVRLGALSTAVRERAMEHSLSRARRARDATYATATQITSTLDLLEGARSTLGAAGLQAAGAPEQLLQRLKEWKDGQPGGPGGAQVEEAEVGAQVEAGGEGREVGVLGPERLEGRALAMVRGLTDQLQAACSGVVSSAQGLPANIQAQLDGARQSAADLRSSLGSSSTVTPLLLEQCRSNLTKVQQSVDGVMDYLIHNTPLNWLVGPFAPQITEKEAAGAEQKPSVQP